MNDCILHFWKYYFVNFEIHSTFPLKDHVSYLHFIISLLNNIFILVCLYNSYFGNLRKMNMLSFFFSFVDFHSQRLVSLRMSEILCMHVCECLYILACVKHFDYKCIFLLIFLRKNFVSLYQKVYLSRIFVFSSIKLLGRF